ncbi:MAG TPA: phage tail protein [Xanthobacteraceae bacterium]|nr:phage tail protein [Xanthobacteraceae bacterium]
MDANGLNFWMLNTAADWLPAGGSDVLYHCAQNGRLQLRSVRLGKAPVEDFAAASALVETAPMTRDAFGNYARWDAAAHNVVAGGSIPGEAVIYAPPAGQTVSDLAMGYDGVLYLAVGGTLVLVDRRNRWPNFTLAAADFSFWRLLALPAGGVLALDRTTPQIGIVAGLPLQVEPAEALASGILRSCQANPDPPQIVRRHALAATEAFIAFTAMAAGRICLLSWGAAAATNKSAFVRVFDQTTGLSNPWTLTETAFPYAIAWLGERRFAILATGLKEALIYDLEGAPATVVPAGDTYVLAGTNAGPFVHGVDATPYYSRGSSIFPLLPLSLNSFAPSGTTTAPNLIDSGSAQTTWHRLFLEAILPPRCGILVSLAVSDDAADFAAGATSPVTWYPHAFGAVAADALPAGTPAGVWLSTPSEVPFARPLLDDAPIADRQGLFMALVQRADVAVRNLTGRYLGIQVRLDGDRRNTPEIAALRVYASRFSYVGHYLPELYRENRFGSDADRAGPSTHRDFFERFVNLFEAQMTRIEDGVANAYLLTRPESAPDDALDWLGSWIGIDAAGYPPDRRRARLQAAPELHRRRGTVDGIVKALDIATDGLCARGAVLVVENFRLRHIFATILGADLAIANDPLLPGYSGSSNSFVGDTLFLGDPRNPDVLALFATAMELPGEQAEVQQFLDTLAYRITVFIHNQVEAVDVSLVQRIVEYEKPAHVAATFQLAAQPFMIGLASLLGVDTYLAPEPPPDPIVVDVSQVGRYGLVQHLPSLDPRWDNGAANVV